MDSPTTLANDTVTVNDDTSGIRTPAWLTVALPFSVIAISLCGFTAYYCLKQRRKAKRAAAAGSPGDQERGDGRSASRTNLSTAAAPMGEGLNELGEAPPPYPPPSDDRFKYNTTEEGLEMREADLDANGVFLDIHDRPRQDMRSGEMGQPTDTTQPPAYGAVVSQGVSLPSVPPTAVCGATVSVPHA